MGSWAPTPQEARVPGSERRTQLLLGTCRSLGAGLPSQALEAAETAVLRPNTTEERAAVLHAACAADCGSPVSFPQRLTRERAVSVSGGTSSPPRATPHSPDAGP